jgi:hypothetical protein
VLVVRAAAAIESRAAIPAEHWMLTQLARANPLMFYAREVRTHVGRTLPAVCENVRDLTNLPCESRALGSGALARVIFPAILHVLSRFAMQPCRKPLAKCDELCTAGAPRIGSASQKRDRSPDD